MHRKKRTHFRSSLVAARSRFLWLSRGIGRLLVCRAFLCSSLEAVGAGGRCGRAEVMVRDESEGTGNSTYECVDGWLADTARLAVALTHSSSLTLIDTHPHAHLQRRELLGHHRNLFLQLFVGSIMLYTTSLKLRHVLHRRVED